MTTTMNRLLLILIAVFGLCIQTPAAQKKKVYVNKHMHIIPSADHSGMYAQLTYEDDHIDAKVYNNNKLLLFHLRLLALTEDTCIYDGWQEHYFYNELKDAYRYENNQAVEHIFYRDGEPIFHQPLQVGDTVWTMGGHIVLREEASTYGIVQSTEHGKIKVNYFRGDSNLVSQNSYSKLEYGNQKKSGLQHFYRNGIRTKVENYNAGGKLVEDYKMDSLGKIYMRTKYMNDKVVEQNYYYPDGHLRASKTPTKAGMEVQYFLPDGTPTDSSTIPTDADEGEVLNVVDRMPEFPGGGSALFAFLSKHVTYPPKAYAMGLQGKVLVAFTVDKDGSIQDIVVIQPVHKLLDDEAKRVIRSMPKWKPGMQDGRLVRVRYTVPINFRLH